MLDDGCWCWVRAYSFGVVFVFALSSFEFQDLGLSFGLQYCGHRLGFDWGKDRALKLDYVNVRYMVPERTSINRKTGV